MLKLTSGEALAVAVVSAIHRGDAERLEELLRENPTLATARIVDASGNGRTLLHIVADWPGHFPNGAQAVATLIAAGADVNAAVDVTNGKHRETPLHWAASSDDVEVLDALLDGGADIEAPGAIFTNGAPMSDAVIFAQWNAARRLLERGARTTLPQAAALGLLDRVQRYCAAQPLPGPDELTNALWNACRGGQRECAEYLLDRGASLNWVGWGGKTPLDAAEEGENKTVIGWLRSRGAKCAGEVQSSGT